MFSRSTPRRRAHDIKTFETPFEELSHNLDRLELLSSNVHKANTELHRPAPVSTSPKSSRSPFLKKLRRRSNDDDDVIMPSIVVTPRAQTSGRRKEDADFVDVDAEDEAEIIECIRRVAELVVIGERSAAAATDHREKISKESDTKENETTPKGKALETDKYIALFEQFFERNGLSLIVSIATGEFFSIPSGDDVNNSYSSDDFNERFKADKDGRMFLPPLAVATQAVQSISILVQNVSRATSLYFILSNNHINQLIQFPLEHYQAAERKARDIQVPSPRRHASPELAELTTHFITFLKSLALRMNVETLQFFLAYAPDENLRNQSADGDKEGAKKVGIDFDGVDEVPVKFPLYARALEFCSAHQDSFVRLTAMNICLNTLRIATVSVENLDDPEQLVTLDIASPDGVLHNAKALPIRERLAIAQHVCAPSRVELLVSPIFTKLAQLWGMLEEQFRELDSLKNTEKTAPEDANVKRRKLIGKFNDIAANLQDELLLFEDVLKVGLTCLNEQAIEMMLATFVYPLLLQPILLYFQRSQVPDEVLFADHLGNYKSGETPSSAASEKSFVSAPAKSALFSLSTIFLFISHQPLLRMIFGALFHPLAPDVIGETVVRSKADVAYLDNGSVVIRVDPDFEKDEHGNPKFKLNYLFGVRPGEASSPPDTPPSSSDDNNNECVFILSPALAEILTATSASQEGLLARTRLNPYRKAILQCLSLSHELSDLKPLAALAIDATVSVFDRNFISGTLFGLQIPDLVHNLPELSSTSFIDEVVGAFQRCIVTLVSGNQENWMLWYDQIAAHGFLCSIRGDDEATTAAMKKLNERCRKAASFLLDIPSSAKALTFDVGPASSPNETQEENQEGFTIDQMFRRRKSRESPLPVVEDLKVLKPEHRGGDGPTHNIAVSKRSSFDELCRRASMTNSGGLGGGADADIIAVISASSWVRIDAFKNLLSTITEKHKVIDLNGVAVTREGETVRTGERQTLHFPLCLGCDSALFDAVTDEDDPSPGTVVELVGHTAIPCVCEALPSCASLFSSEGARVIADGVTWQSLYLVIFGQYMILAEPERSSSNGSGRVVTCCLLERLTVEHDDLSPNRAESSARRLLISFEGSETSPTPGLFLHDDATATTKSFFASHHWRSSLDCWFEDALAANHAYDVLHDRIKIACAQRGKRIQKYLVERKNND